MALLHSRLDRCSKASCELWKKIYYIKDSNILLLWWNAKTYTIASHCPGYFGTLLFGSGSFKTWTPGWVFATGHFWGPPSQGGRRSASFPIKGLQSCHCLDWLFTNLALPLTSKQRILRVLVQEHNAEHIAIWSSSKSSKKKKCKKTPKIKATLHPH